MLPFFLLFAVIQQQNNRCRRCQRNRTYHACEPCNSEGRERCSCTPYSPKCWEVFPCTPCRPDWCEEAPFKGDFFTKGGRMGGGGYRPPVPPVPPKPLYLIKVFEKDDPSVPLKRGKLVIRGIPDS